MLQLYLQCVGHRTTWGVSTRTPTSAHLGEVTMQLTPSQTRTLETRDVANLWRDMNGPIPDAVELKFNTALKKAGW